MNIIEFLKSKTNSHHNLKYYGLEDMATGMSISAFVKDLDLIVEYANKIDYKIDSVDSFIDYAYFNVAMQYEEAIPSIKPEYIEQFTKTLSKLKEIYLKFEKKDVMVSNNTSYFDSISKITFLHKIENSCEPMVDTINIANSVNKHNVL